MTSSPPADPGPRKSFDWKNLRLRLLSAAVLVPVAVACVAYGHAAYLVLVFVAVALLASEWAKMSAPASVSPLSALLAASILPALMLATVKVRYGWAVLPASALLAMLVARVAGWAGRTSDAGVGVLYLGAPAISLLWLRDDLPLSGGLDGFDWTALLLVATWGADVFAFAGGSVLKGPRLWPRISPNKTWSGFACGLLGAVASVAALWAAHLRGQGGLSLGAVAAIGLAGGLATMGGDLLESTLKRRFGVKDSGDLIPGHGGLLDRVDGLMAAALALAGARLLAQAGVLR